MPNLRVTLLFLVFLYSCSQSDYFADATGTVVSAICEDGSPPPCNPPPPPPSCHSCCPTCPPQTVCPLPPPPCPTCPPVPFCPPPPLTCPGPGCPATGNLPVSRTLTLGPNDPIPTSLINEIQDNIIGHKRAPYDVPFRPILHLVNPSGAVTTVSEPGGLVQQYVYKVPPGTLIQFDIPFQAGDTFIGFRIELYGDGIVDMGFSVSYGATPTDGWRNIRPVLEVSNVPPAWVTYPIAPFSRLTTSTEKLTVALSVNSAASPTSALYIRQAIATFQRF